MSSSISSSEPGEVRLWRRFFRLAAGTAALSAGFVYAFVVLVDPFNILPLSPPLDRPPVTHNQRFSYPALARSPAFDSAILGTSTARLLRPVTLNPEFNARFVNLAMNDATAYEISRLFRVFARAHPVSKVFMLGVDVRWCVTGDTYEQLTPRAFPTWMYEDNLWRGYAEMFNLFAVQEAGRAFGELTGLRPEDMGRDGYTRFVPPDAEYDAARALTKLRESGPRVPPGERSGDPAAWRYPTLDILRDDLALLSPGTRKVLLFVPYNHRLLLPLGSPGAAVWDECKRRVASLARAAPNSLAVDFMLPSPITNEDANYWDGLHYRAEVADRLDRDLAAAERGDASDDYRILYSSRAVR
jgi:hypothetical protein